MTENATRETKKDATRETRCQSVSFGGHYVCMHSRGHEGCHVAKTERGVTFWAVSGEGGPA